MSYEESYIEGRNAVMEALRSGRPIDKLYILDGCHDGPVSSIRREAKKRDAIIKFVEKEFLDRMSSTGRHQGVIAVAAAYEYAEKATDAGEQIYDGKMSPEPLKEGGNSACTWCSFSAVCRFDLKCPGFRENISMKASPGEVFQVIEEEEEQKNA